MIKKFLAFFVVVLAIVACTRTEDKYIAVPVNNQPGIENDANGTSDGGGGDIDKSTPEEIKKAVFTAQKALLNENLWQKFYYPRYNYETLKLSENFIQGFQENADFYGYPDLDSFMRSVQFASAAQDKLYPIIDSIDKPRSKHILLYQIEQLKSRINYTKDKAKIQAEINELQIQYKAIENKLPESKEFLIPNIKINFAENGPCPASNSDHADASVSEYTFFATICFSTHTLQRISPDDLLAHMTGLWLHELGHMAGEKNEDWAQILEKTGSTSLDLLMSGGGQPWEYQTGAQLTFAMINIQNIRDLIVKALNEKENNPTIFESNKNNYYKSITHDFGHSSGLISAMIEIYSNIISTKLYLDEDQKTANRHRVLDQKMINQSSEFLEEISKLKNIDLNVGMDTHLLNRIEALLIRMENLEREFDEAYEPVDPL